MIIPLSVGSPGLAKSFLGAGGRGPKHDKQYLEAKCFKNPYLLLPETQPPDGEEEEAASILYNRTSKQQHPE